MSLTRPTLLSMASFDATQAQTFTFTVQAGSSQIVSNQLTIRDQTSNTIIYQQTQTTFKYEHILPANTLTNGTYYNATIVVYDNAGDSSPASVPIQFYCYTTPVITFTNIPSNLTITNASFSFNFTYTQTEGEAINSYVVNLYNAFQSLVSSSSTVYVEDGTPPYNGSYLFSGLQNNTTYYIEIVGTTVNNTIISTGNVRFFVQYSTPGLFSLVELTNNCDEGYITIQSNIISIDPVSNPDPPVYIDNQEADLTSNGSYVTWNSGYSISNDFIARIWFRNPNSNSTILNFTNVDGSTITLNYMTGYENISSQTEQCYIQCTVSGLTGNYYIISDFMDILDETQQYNVWLTRVNNIYELQWAEVSSTL